MLRGRRSRKVENSTTYPSIFVMLINGLWNRGVGDFHTDTRKREGGDARVWEQEKGAKTVSCIAHNVLIRIWTMSQTIKVLCFAYIYIYIFLTSIEGLSRMERHWECSRKICCDPNTWKTKNETTWRQWDTEGELNKHVTKQKSIWLVWVENVSMSWVFLFILVTH